MESSYSIVKERLLHIIRTQQFEQTGSRIFPG